MLKQRILTAVVVGPLILWSVVAFSHRALAIELGAILALAAWEWARLSGITNQFARIIYSVVICGVFWLLTWVLHRHIEYLQLVLYAACLWWLIAFILVVLFDRRGWHTQRAMSPINKFVNLVIGLIILAGAFVSITGLHQSADYGYVYILLLLAIIWVADSAAYFAGKAFGRHKLAPNVSPGKTWEGVAGAVLACTLLAIGITQFLEFEYTTSFNFVIVALITMFISIVGDLLVSLFKRRAGVKDSSRLLPGHGGILDRIDSLLAAAPLFLLGLLSAGIKS